MRGSAVPILPASLLQSFPPATRVPIYSPQPTHFPDYPLYSAYQAEAPPPQSYYVLRESPRCGSFYSTYSFSAPEDVLVELNPNLPMAAAAAAPAEVVDLDTYSQMPIDVAGPVDFHWSNSNSADNNQNWVRTITYLFHHLSRQIFFNFFSLPSLQLQPITLFTEGQQEADILDFVEETFQRDLNENL